MNRKDVRRKHSSVDLQQVVTRIDVYKRPLKCANGKSGALFGISHEAAVATTETDKLYMIEKGVGENDDINYQVRYREGESRIVQVTKMLIRDWTLVRSVVQVKSGLTLEDLFDSCGTEYSFLADNCWNSTQRMRVCANESEDGLPWQGKAAVGGAVALGAAALFGALVYATRSSSEESKEKKKKPQKY